MPLSAKIAIARAALILLADKLIAINNTTGELQADARLAWLDSTLPLDTTGALRVAIDRVGDVVSFVDNWAASLNPDLHRPHRVPGAADLRRARLVVIGLGNLSDADVAAMGVSRDAGALIDVAELLRARAEVLTEAGGGDDEGEERVYRTLVEPAQEAAQGALDALCDLVDTMRAQG